MNVPGSGSAGGRLRVAAVAMMVGVLALLGAGPAAAADPPPRVRAVTIDCIGDTIAGHIGIQNPVTMADAVRVTLYGRSGTGPFQVIESKLVGMNEDQFEVAYSFVVRRHRTEYRVLAETFGSRRYSQRIHDKTCQPPAEVSETGLALGIPAAMGLAGAAAWYLRRRRSTGAPVAAA